MAIKARRLLFAEGIEDSDDKDRASQVAQWIKNPPAMQEMQET